MAFWWSTRDDLAPIAVAIDALRSEVQALQRSVLGVVSQLKEEMMLDFSRLQSEAQRETDAQAAALGVLQGLADQLKTSAGDQATVNSIADQLKTNADALAAAIVSGTPADTGGGGPAAASRSSR